jgi:3'-5' exoribonuclease
MKDLFISDLKAGASITGFFLCTDKQVATKDDGTAYLRLTLSDKTGSVAAIIWDTPDGFEVGDFVKVAGVVGTYRDKPQLKVNRIRKAFESEIDPADFFAVSKRDRGEMMEELQGLIRSVEDPHLARLLVRIVVDGEVHKLLPDAPAASVYHHAYRGGLLEHILNLIGLAGHLAPTYKVSRDLLIAAAVLHDIGKVYELDFSRSTEYTVAGNLLGHISIGMAFVWNEIRQIEGFPEDLARRLLHILASHHGSKEAGSPVLPQTKEAWLFHLCDLMDSRMGMADAALDSPEGDETWTAKHWGLGVALWRGAK